MCMLSTDIESYESCAASKFAFHHRVLLLLSHLSIFFFFWGGCCCRHGNVENIGVQGKDTNSAFNLVAPGRKRGLFASLLVQKCVRRLTRMSVTRNIYTTDLYPCISYQNSPLPPPPTPNIISAIICKRKFERFANLRIVLLLAMEPNDNQKFALLYQR